MSPATNSPPITPRETNVVVVAARLPASQLAKTWVRIDQWARGRGLTQAYHTTRGKDDYYDLSGPFRHFKFLMGSTVAQWNGVEFWLGFPPHFAEGHPVCNGLDVEKLLSPLLDSPLRLTKSHPTILLDPGHGGPLQVGTKSILYRRFEKEYTLDWANRLAVLLTADGWNVKLSRTGDTDMTLTNRVAAAQAANADLFLSLHFNSSAPRQDQSGVETYCMTPEGMPSNIKRDYEDDPRLVTPNNAYDHENLQLAALLHREILETVHCVDRGVRHARFMGVLRGQNRPAVLIEGGYLSNPEEAGLIDSPAYRQRLAEAVARGLRKILPESDSTVTLK